MARKSDGSERPIDVDGGLPMNFFLPKKFLAKLTERKTLVHPYMARTKQVQSLLASALTASFCTT
jgi:hypothetical protein